LGSTTPIIWKPDTFKGKKQNEFYEQACGFGLRSGITYPVHGASGEFGMLSFVSNDLEHVAKNECFDALAHFSLIRDYVFESSLKFLGSSDYEQDSVALTSRELECLKWIMEGKSSWEISNILRRSESAVNFHVTNLKRKFNVNTRQQAVVKAIKMGMLSPP
ncbi:MAG: helix-turn-helix transcriptional regulator, partial [Burkholderiales bacterium]